MRVFAILLIVLAAAAAASSRPVHQKDFASPDAAVQALIKTLRSGDKHAVLEVLGPQAEPAIDSGDPVQDADARDRFLQSYAVAHALHNAVEGRSTLEVGADQWPFPFPLVRRAERWIFDSAAGTEEIVNRRVGKNELSTIQSCLAAVDAEREYYARNPQNDSLLQFAQKLISTAGKKDGLYWPTSGDEPPSPLGEGFARARGEGYFRSTTPNAEPFHGYMYRVLTKQGVHANGGAYDYLVGDKMPGGFALLAFPGEYGSTGVLTFIVNHDGIVFSKDLGPQTPKTAMAIEVFDPDPSWKREAAID